MGKMSPAQLQEFMKVEQGDSNIGIDGCKQMISVYEKKKLKRGSTGSDKVVEPEVMTETGFLNMLLSPPFRLYKNENITTIYQDMTRPLSHYFISTSHNT